MSGLLRQFDEILLKGQIPLIPDAATKWAKCDLREIIATIDQGWSPQCEKESAASFQDWAVIKTTAIQPLNFSFIENKKLPKNLAPKLELEICSNDILITRAGPRSRVAICCIVNDIRPRLILCDKAYRLRANELLTYPKYLVYFLNSPHSTELLDTLKTGISESGVNLTQQKLLSFKVPLAPLPEQKRITDKLDAVLARVDACRDRLNRVPLILKRFRQSVLAAATSGQLTADWREQQVGWADAGSPTSRDTDTSWASQAQPNLQTDEEKNLIGWINTDVQSVATVGTGSTPLRSNTNFFSETGTPWVTSAATSTQYVSRSFEYVTAEAIKAHRLKCYPIGTLLVAMYGEGKTRGQVSELAIIATINQACAAVVVDENRALRAFVKLTLQANYLEMREMAEGGNQPNLNLSKIKEFNLLLPSLQEQHEIVRRVETLFAFADRLEARLATARAATERLTPALLAKAFRGELVPQDPADEPAAALLQRLAASRAEAGTKPRRARAAKV